MTCRRRDEEGAVLVLVLAVITVLALVAGAVISQADANLKSGDVVDEQARASYAADGGVEFGIQSLRTTSTNCPTPGSTSRLDVPSDSLSIGGHTVEVSCRDISGVTTGMAGWAAYVRDNIDTSNGSATKKIEGALYYGGTWSLGKPLSVTGGDIIASGAACTFPSPSSLIGPTPNPPYRRDCPAAAPVVPAIAQPGTAAFGSFQDITAAPGTTCRRFTPGKYDATHPFTLAATNYLQSGVYVFTGVAIDLKGNNVLGGTPYGETAALGLSGCAGADPAGSGYGVELVLDAGSSISMENNSAMELFTRQNSATDNASGVSIYAATTTHDNVLTQCTGSNCDLVVHGAVYAPNRNVSIREVSNNNAVTLSGGVAAWDLTLHDSNSSIALISSKNSPGQRLIEVTATAKGLAGAKDVTATAIVEVFNDVNRVAQIRSWQTNP
jgi:hypothetical protein